MANCQEEFLDEVGNKKLLCVKIFYGAGYWDESRKKSARLPVGFTEADLKNFLDSINFTYDNSWGSQELFGIIWYKDGTWSERAEYDGSEWWEHKVCPKIPEDLGGAR